MKFAQSTTTQPFESHEEHLISYCSKKGFNPPQKLFIITWFLFSAVLAITSICYLDTAASMKGNKLKQLNNQTGFTSQQISQIIWNIIFWRKTKNNNHLLFLFNFLSLGLFKTLSYHLTAHLFCPVELLILLCLEIIIIVASHLQYNLKNVRPCVKHQAIQHKTIRHFRCTLTRTTVLLASSSAWLSGQTICFACEALWTRTERGAGEGVRDVELFHDRVILRSCLSKVNNS